MERFLIDTGIFILGVSIGFLIGNQVDKLKEEEVKTSTAEPIAPAAKTEPVEPAKPAKKKKVILTPSVA